MGQNEILEFLSKKRKEGEEYFTLVELQKEMGNCRQSVWRSVGKLKRRDLIEFTYGNWDDWKLRVRAKK